MLDDSDADFAVLSTPDGSDAKTTFGAVMAILFLIAAVAIMIVVYYNKEECAQKKCERGEPILANHKCLCAEEAK